MVSVSRNDAAAQSPKEWGQRGTSGVSFASNLSFEEVSVKLGQRPVLDRLDLNLVQGEIVCLLGESGSGKSTLLRAAAGLQRLDSGQLRINGRVVSGPGIHLPPERRGVGLMFQDFALFPHMTVLENVVFGLVSLGKANAVRQARAALARVGLADREYDLPHNLSGGQQQRLALARSIAPRPGILLLDEPFSGLDARMRETVRAETLAVLRETRATSLIVTHDPEEAMLLGDRIALLRQGRIIQIDLAANVYSAPIDLAAARFLSPLSEIDAIVSAGAAKTPLGPVPTPGFADGTRVSIGLRPVGAISIATVPGGVPGRVIAKRNALGLDMIEIRVEGIEGQIHLRRPADSGLIPGRDIFVSLNVADVLVFAQD